MSIGTDQGMQHLANWTLGREPSRFDQTQLQRTFLSDCGVLAKRSQGTHEVSLHDLLWTEIELLDAVEETARIRKVRGEEAGGHECLRTVTGADAIAADQ